MKVLLQAVILSLLIISCSSQESASKVHQFNANWKFLLCNEQQPDSAIYSATDFDDSEWRSLQLPHDWAIEGDFSKDNPSGTGGGALPGGIGWYRKTFNITPEELELRHYITFDGVYMNSTVYLNGHELGHRPYGYVSFQYDMTEHLHEGQNVIAVRVDNSDQPNSRWYSGCGIYRNVWMSTSRDLRVANWGTFVTTPLVNDEEAKVSAEITLESFKRIDRDVTIISDIVDANGKVITTNKVNVTVTPFNKAVAHQNFDITKPHRWSLNDPYQYKLITRVYEKKQLYDTYETRFGIRQFYFDENEGFILNGERVKINGVCLHHDLGCLGAAVNTRAIERQLQIMKDMGCNGIRCSHNPPAPELLNLCDSMGFIVMDETFDMWRKRKTANDYARFFDEWHEQDMTEQILRDRNHPSIFMWSIGNEVLEQWTQTEDSVDLAAVNLILNKKRDASALAYGNELSNNSLLCQHLCEIVHKLDPTRPITAGNNEPSPNNHLFKANCLDIIGFNYHNDWFEAVPVSFPHKPFIVTESVSALMTRGYYRMPSTQTFLWPERWDKPFYDRSFSCSSYDNTHVPWGNSHEETLRLVNAHDFISGQYIWTGFDYIGEPTPFGWPARSSYFGIVDLAGFPKDIYYFYQSEWTDKDVLHMFPHWNWKEGQQVDIWCYYNNADEVELFVNGSSQGTQRKDSLHRHAMWPVHFHEGSIRVVARKDGHAIREKVINTAGRPHHLRITPDRDRIFADGYDLSFITVEVLDKDDNLCPEADNDIQFIVEGTGLIAGVDNGSPISMERFKDNHRKAFYGKCLLVVQSDGNIGNIRIRAESPHLNSAEAVVHCLPQERY